MRVGRLPALLALAAVLPACGGGRDEPAGRFILFSEDFAATTLSGAWIVSGGGAVEIDTLEGTPAPSLSLFPPNGPAFATLTVTTSAVFSAASPLSFEVDVLLLEFPAPTGLGSAAVTIFDPAFPATGASALYNPETFTIDFEINGVLGPAVVDAGGWHRVMFSIDAAGRASWWMDGVLQQTVAGFPIADLVLRLRNDSDSVFNFDSVLVTSP
jgi:hypothetical protein